MDLDRILRGIRALEDLPGLLAALGHQPLLDPVPDLCLRGGVSAVAVGRAGNFPWFALASTEPIRSARSLARRLAARGQTAGVIALDAQTRRLALSVAFEGSPVIAIELASAAPVALASLGRIAGVGQGGVLTYAARVADALSAEAAGSRFFREFKSTLERMTAELPGLFRGADRHAFVMLQLTRVLFLYFVQAKGWLAGRERFLAEEVNSCLAGRRSIHRHLLRPLFFGTLNRPIAGRGRAAARFGAIPFLNGGLFEPHPLERKIRHDIPNAAWREAFDRLFERFQFTVAEGAGDGGIAPDMLGRVFEGVMAPDARRASGTFYTPSALVGQILDAALPASVASRLNCTENEADLLLGSGNPRALAAVEGLTILDPAVGSGAFLLGALERLAALGPRRVVDLTTRKRTVLQRNLFGVDRSATAVRLAELRLWLAVIAGDQTERPGRVQPLPNLDCLVRQGDSLFDPVGCGAEPAGAAAPLAARISELRRSVVVAVGQAKRPLVRELHLMETRAAHESFTLAEERIDGQIGECLRMARGRDLFGERRGLDAALLARLAHLRTQVRAVRTARRTLSREHELPWFHYQSHFADVFAAGGFDLVLGNPPWLRAEQIPAEQRHRLSGRYRWWRAGGGFGNRPDLSVAFLERALELVAPGGVVALLLPAKLATARYGAAARHALATTTTLVRVADLTEHADATFDATVYPLALIARNSPAPPGHRVRTSLRGGKGESIPQARLGGGGPWILSAGRACRVLAALTREFPRLDNHLSCHLGLKTGANALFLDPPGSVEPELIRFAIRGRDVRAFAPLPGVRLLYTHGTDGKPLATLPPGAAAHLAPHTVALRARTDFDGGPPWALFRTRAASAAHRVIWPDLARELTAAALTDEQDCRSIPLNTCYVAAAESKPEAERVAAWLNCTWIRLTARLGAVPAASGFARFGAGTIGSLPLPTAVLSNHRLGALALSARVGGQIQHELDDLAAGHLGLSAPDQDALRALVAPGTSHRR